MMTEAELEKADELDEYTDRKRMVAYNAHMADEVGIIWCMVVEDEAGYRPMTGRDPLAAPWYLAQFDNHRDEEGSIDQTAVNENAEATANSYNLGNGYTRREVMEVVSSSMRAQNIG